MKRLLFSLLAFSSVTVMSQDIPPPGSKQAYVNQTFIAPDTSVLDRFTAPGISAFYKKRIDRKTLDSIYVYSNAITLYNNLRVAGWGDSMTRGTGSPGAPNTDTYLYYLGLLSNHIFYNGGNNGETSEMIKNRMRLDTAKHHWKTMIWAGRNDITNSVSTSRTKANIDTMVNILPHDNYLVIGVTYKQSEIIGTSVRDTITTLNNYLSTKYAGHFYNPNPVMLAGYNSSLSQDVIDHANGVFPTSLGSGDGTHFNSAGQKRNADATYKAFKSLYVNKYIVTPENIAFAMDKPVPIGNGTPNTGSFSKLTLSDTVANKNLTFTVPMSNIVRSGSVAVPSGQFFNYASTINNNTSLSSGAGNLYNVGLLLDASNGVAAQGNIAMWAKTGSVHIGTSTSGFNYPFGVDGISRFGVTGAINGDMLVANKLTVNQGTTGLSTLGVNSTGSTGSANLEISNTAASGVTWRFRLGGNTANTSAGLGVNEGNLSLYEVNASKIALHFMKTSTNIGIHGQIDATAYLHLPAGGSTPGTSPIKLTSGSLLATPENGALELDGSNLYITIAGVRYKFVLTTP